MLARRTMSFAAHRVQL